MPGTDRPTDTQCWVFDPPPASLQSRPPADRRLKGASDCIGRALISNMWKAQLSVNPTSGLCLTPPAIFVIRTNRGTTERARAPGCERSRDIRRCLAAVATKNGPAPHAVSDAGSALAAAPTRPAGCWVPLHIRGDELHERSRECCQCVRLPRLRRRQSMVLRGRPVNLCPG